MTNHPIPKDVDENEFIDASRLVYEGVRHLVFYTRLSKKTTQPCKIWVIYNARRLTLVCALAHGYIFIDMNLRAKFRGSLFEVLINQ